LSLPPFFLDGPGKRFDDNERIFSGLDSLCVKRQRRLLPLHAWSFIFLSACRGTADVIWFCPLFFSRNGKLFLFFSWFFSFSSLRVWKATSFSFDLDTIQLQFPSPYVYLLPKDVEEDPFSPPWQGFFFLFRDGL